MRAPCCPSVTTCTSWRPPACRATPRRVTRAGPPRWSGESYLAAQSGTWHYLQGHVGAPGAPAVADAAAAGSVLQVKHIWDTYLRGAVDTE